MEKGWNVKLVYEMVNAGKNNYEREGERMLMAGKHKYWGNFPAW